MKMHFKKQVLILITVTVSHGSINTLQRLNWLSVLLLTGKLESGPVNVLLQKQEAPSASSLFEQEKARFRRECLSQVCEVQLGSKGNNCLITTQFLFYFHKK